MGLLVMLSDACPYYWSTSRWLPNLHGPALRFLGIKQTWSNTMYQFDRLRQQYSRDFVILMFPIKKKPNICTWIRQDVSLVLQQSLVMLPPAIQARSLRLEESMDWSLPPLLGALHSSSELHIIATLAVAIGPVVGHVDYIQALSCIEMGLPQISWCR